MAKAHFHSGVQGIDNERLVLLHNESTVPFILSDSYIKIETPSQYLIDTTFIPITKHFAIQLFGKKDQHNHRILPVKESTVQRFNTISFCRRNLIAISGAGERLKNLLANEHKYSNKNNENHLFACDDSDVYYPLKQNEDLSNMVHLQISCRKKPV